MIQSSVHAQRMKQMKLKPIDVLAVTFIGVGLGTCLTLLGVELIKMKLEASPDRLARFEQSVPGMLGFGTFNAGITCGSSLIIWSVFRRSILNSVSPEPIHKSAPPPATKSEPALSPSSQPVWNSPDEYLAHTQEFQSLVELDARLAKQPPPQKIDAPTPLHILDELPN